ncbi:Mannosyl-oligosaccharide 1,2-alpha-mannosidase IB [Entomortierella lignicola]|nr:Mannosyl-oligosaccharide 1,2-alpha-mannosidase IB [Entomortierella lignicola]
MNLLASNSSRAWLDAKHSIDDSLPDYLTVGEILERPLGGPAPIKGVDENGLEILEEETLTKNEDPAGVSADTTTTTTWDTFKIRRPVQYNFRDTLPRTGARAGMNKQRLTVIKDMIQHAWTGYVKYAAPHDELGPVTAKKLDSSDNDDWGGSTLIGSMDTLLLAGMSEEYQLAKRMFLDEIKQNQRNQQEETIADEETIPEDEEIIPEDEEIIPEDEETIPEDEEENQESEDDPTEKDNGIHFYKSVVRHLGAMLSVIELEQQAGESASEILDAAVKLGDQLAQAFIDSKHLPANTIYKNGTVAAKKILGNKVSLAEVGTFQIEFRKLSQLSGNDKFAKIADKNFEYFSSLQTMIPGLYPAYFDPEKFNERDDYVASFGSLSDGFYEYLLKTYALTGDVKFKELYTSTIDAMHGYLTSQPHKRSGPYLVLGIYNTATASLVPKMDHSTCFAPGLLALGARMLGRSKDMTTARGLMETCYLSYKNSATGLGADEIGFLGAEFSNGLMFEMPSPSGFYVIDPEYGLRPETVESLFILYRITGDPRYQDYAWKIAQSIEKNCRTRYGYSTLANVMDASDGMTDKMPSHFLAQTLKYLYLIFSSPDVASLDDYLFTTEGHLIKYPI